MPRSAWSCRVSPSPPDARRPTSRPCDTRCGGRRQWRRRNRHFGDHRSAEPAGGRGPTKRIRHRPQLRSVGPAEHRLGSLGHRATRRNRRYAGESGPPHHQRLRGDLTAWAGARASRGAADHHEGVNHHLHDQVADNHNGAGQNADDNHHNDDNHPDDVPDHVAIAIAVPITIAGARARARAESRRPSQAIRPTPPVPPPRRRSARVGLNGIKVTRLTWRSRSHCVAWQSRRRADAAATVGGQGAPPPGPAAGPRPVNAAGTESGP